MIVEVLIVRNSGKEQRFEAPTLPIRLGTDTASEIRLPGPGSKAVALVDFLDGEPFIQPMGVSDGTLKVNGDSVKTSRRLSAGDELEFYGTRVLIEVAGRNLILELQFEGSAYITKPPDLGSDVSANEPIMATTFERSSESAQEVVESSGLSWQAIVGGVITVLIAASALLFTSKSIQIDVQPAGADEVSITGGWFRLPLGDRILLREGSYNVNVRKAGYYEAVNVIEVDETPSQSFVIQMRKLPGRLFVSTTPPVEAIAMIDDIHMGTVPYGPLELEPGTHSVNIEAKRFLPYSQRLKVPGLGLVQYLEVQLVPQWANIEISSVPSGAGIYRDMEKVGETPIRLELLEGSHQLSLIKDGFKAWDFSVTAEANIDQVHPTVLLEPANAKLRVLTIPKGANVMVNGRYRGQSPATVSLSPDIDYVIGLSKAGYGSTTRQIRLEAAASQEISVDLTARTGEIIVKALPGDATIYVDGRARGIGAVTMQLSSAPHRIEIKRDGYVTQTREVVPRPGYPQTISLRLLSEAELAEQSIARLITNSQGQALRRIEAGTFTMGTSRSERGRQANEVLVPVTITMPYFIGVKEITNREFRRFRPNHDSGGSVHISLVGDHNPVANVTWDNAIEYLNWLSAQEGLVPAYEKVFERWQPVLPTPNGYRLPTEAEWVWAIRYQGKPRSYIYTWGNNRLPPPTDSGNWAGRSANALVNTIIPGWDDGYASTAPVGTFKPNSLGIFDGGGNVAEWVQDYYQVPTPGQTEPIKDPTGPIRGSNRVIRGSSWGHAGIRELRSGYRAFGSSSYWDVGFRIARNVE
ncbi:MAG: hypothetical protein CMO98_06265 [Woeseia sp.]|nr:hypothetical protein [Woeseia sp.]